MWKHPIDEQLEDVHSMNDEVDLAYYGNLKETFR